MMKNIWSNCWKWGRRFTRRILGFCLILCAVLVSASEGNSVNTDPVKDNSKILNRQNGGKLFIELGWDIPDTSFLRSNYVEMESAAPFDGVIYRLSGKDEEGGIHHTEWAWDKSKWKWEWFIPAVEDLKSCRFQKFHHNFIRFNFTSVPHRLYIHGSDAALDEQHQFPDRRTLRGKISGTFPPGSTLWPFALVY